MKIILVDPASFGDLPGAMQPSLGFGYLAATLMQEGIEVEVFDMRLNYSIKDLKDKLSQSNPDVVGVTAYSVKFENTRNVIDTIIDEGYTVVVGGPHVSACKTDVLEKTKADFAVMGEGEHTLIELLEFFEKGRTDYGNINGLIWRKDVQIIENKEREYIHDFDSIPFPAYEIFELDKYTFTEERRLPIITSRGCPYRCVFCSVKLCMGNGFRARSPENVIEEIDHWYSQGWRQFDIQDDCFNFDMDRAKKILDLIIGRDYDIKILLGNGIRVDKTDEELVSKLKQAGCTYLQYGVETGDKDTLRKIRKGSTLEQALTTLKITREAGIETSVNFIIGLPDETPERAMNTIKFAEELEKKGELINVYNLVPYPGTEAFTYAQEHGTFTMPIDEYLSNITYGTDNPIFYTPEFSIEDRERILKKGLSIARRSWMKKKFGNTFGYIVWMVTGWQSLYKFATRIVLSTNLGRGVYNLLKRD